MRTPHVSRRVLLRLHDTGHVRVTRTCMWGAAPSILSCAYTAPGPRSAYAASLSASEVSEYPQWDTRVRAARTAVHAVAHALRELYVRRT